MRASRRLRLCLAVAAWALVAVVCGSHAKADRIVAVGDIHGADQELVSLLQTTGLIDDERNWIGSGTTFVQTGDYTDRGTGMRPVLDLLIRIENQASRSGDDVRVLLGNHEVMNLIYQDRDLIVNPAIYASFADEDSEERRKKAYKRWRSWRAARQRAQARAGGEAEVSEALTSFLEQSEEEWLAAHPPGLIEHREAFGPKGVYGIWLRKRPVATTVGQTLFVHGGISPLYQDASVEEINELHRTRIEEWSEDRSRLERRGLVLPYFSFGETRLALEHHLRFPETLADRQLAIETWDRLNQLLGDLFGPESPLWFRGYAAPPLGLEDEALAALLDVTDAAYGVRRTVAGHTPAADRRILSRLDGRAFQIDTGMLTAYYKGRPAALEISGAGTSSVYLPGDELTTPVGTNGGAHEEEPAQATTPTDAEAATEVGSERRVFVDADGERLPFQSREAVEDFLRSATVVSHKPIGKGKSGALKLLLERHGVRTHAVFHDIDERRVSGGRPVRLGDGKTVANFRDSYSGNLAAYELAKLLEIENMPPVVARRVNGKDGSVALWIENGIDLFDWREQGNEDPKDPGFWRQMYDVRVFDEVIDNFDRNTTNIFWTGDYDVWMIDQTRSFTRARKAQRPQRITRCSRQLFEALKALDEEVLKEHLSDFLSTFEIRATLSRRDHVVEILEQKIADKGEHRILFDREKD